MTAENFLVVSTPSIFKVDKEFSDDRFLRVRIAVMHSGENLNGSSFPTSVIEDAKDTFANIPVLANVVRYTDEDGNERYDYSGHDMHIEEDAFNEGEYRVIYDEAVVGVVPESNNFEIVHDDEKDQDFVYVDAFLYREYGNYCTDILESRGNTTDISAEIYLDNISFDAANKVVLVNKMRMSGITLLGADVTPAMTGANATVFSHSREDLQSQLIKVAKELTDALAKYTAAISETTGEGGSTKVKFDELLAKYNVTAEDVTFEYENLTDEELEAAFEEHFAQPDEAEAAEEEAAADPEVGQEAETEAESAEAEEEAEEDGEEDEESESTDENFAKMTINVNGAVHEFSVSLQDKISALYELVNNTYADADGCWYDVTVYDDDKYVIMTDWWTGKGYKQSYKVKKDVYTLVGDRVEVFTRWLTQDEINALDKMKADYAVMEEKLSHYEEEPQKMEILQSDDYSLIAENEEFVALCEQANHFNMSVDEMTAKADAILTAAAKQHKFSAIDPEKKASVKPLPAPKKKAKRFGTLFDGII